MKTFIESYTALQTARARSKALHEELVRMLMADSSLDPKARPQVSWWVALHKTEPIDFFYPGNYQLLRDAFRDLLRAWHHVPNAVDPRQEILKTDEKMQGRWDLQWQIDKWKPNWGQSSVFTRKKTA